MTACVNRKHSKKVAAVVTASLVGALSIGAAAPVVAFAEEGISLQATEDAAIAGAEVEYKGGEPATEFTYTGRPQGPIPTKVTPTNEDTERVSLNPYVQGEADTREAGAFYYWYVDMNGTTDNMAGTGVKVKNDKGSLVALSGSFVMENGEFVKPTNQGEYAIVIAQYVDGTDWNYVGVADTFEIVGQSLDDAVLIDGDDVNDTQFNFTGKSGSMYLSEWIDRINVALDGIKLEDTDYSLEVWAQGGTAALNPASDALLTNTKYIVKVIGQGRFDGQVAEKELTIGKLNLSDAVVLGNVVDFYDGFELSSATTAAQAVKSINGIAWSDLSQDNACTALLDVEFVSDPNGSQTNPANERGAYTFKLRVDPDKVDNEYVEGETEFTVYRADFEGFIDFSNCGTADSLSSTYNTFVTDLSDDKPDYFDLDDIKVTYGPTGQSLDVPEEGYTITVTDAEGNVVTDLTKPGTYTVRVDVDWTNSSDRYVAGSDYATVIVSYSVKQANDVFLSYDGQNVDESKGAYPKQYNGEDHTSHFSVVVKAGSKTLVEGTDYKVVYQKVQDDGKVVNVDEIVDAGQYNVVVEGITFSSDAVFDFEVTPVVISDVHVVTPYTVGTSAVPALAWTGEVLTPSFEWDSDGDGKCDTVIPADLYDVEYTSDVDDDGVAEAVELKDKGDYTAYLTTKDGVVNYEIDAKVDFKVSDAKVYSDVDGSYWAAENIYKAKKLEYMGGYNGTTFFGPLDNIKRGDVAVVLYNMAGKPMTDDLEDMKDETGSYQTGFADQIDGMYYNQAIAWAKSVGIVSGDEGTNCFRPEDSISRQELAKMLCVYAEKTGKDTNVDADAVLADYEDANTVSDWAKDYVAWAVEADLMGQDSPLRGTDPINRAEVATMAVRLQPKKLANSEDLFN